jgi:hypothetical protein
MTEAERLKEIAADPFGIHEALHSAYIAQCVFDEQVAEHPAVSERPELAALAEKASDAIMAVYQAIGNLPERRNA